MLFHETSSFFQVLAEKLTKAPKHASLLQKFLVFAKSMIFHAFSPNEQLLPENLMKTPIHVSLLEKLPVSAKSMISRGLSRNEKLFATFGSKVDESAKIRLFAPKVSRFCQIDDFSCLFTK